MTQFSDDPFAVPKTVEETGIPGPRAYPPTVATWQIVYVVLMLIMYVAVFIGGAALIIFRETIGQDPDFEMTAGEALIMGSIYAGVGAVLSVLYLVGIFWRRGMGGWIYNLILIALGMTSCCTWPMTIPLLIFWIRDKDAIVSG